MNKCTQWLILQISNNNKELKKIQKTNWVLDMSTRVGILELNISYSFSILS